MKYITHVTPELVRTELQKRKIPLVKFIHITDVPKRLAANFLKGRLSLRVSYKHYIALSQGFNRLISEERRFGLDLNENEAILYINPIQGNHYIVAFIDLISLDWESYKFKYGEYSNTLYEFCLSAGTPKDRPNTHDILLK